MNLPRFTAFVAFLALTPLAPADLSPVGLRIEQVNQHDDNKFTTTQKKSLKVFLTNATKQDYAGLKVKYFYFGRDVKSRNVKLVEKGEQPAEVKSLNTTLVETPAASAKSVEGHSEGGNLNKQNKNQKTDYGKKVAASGEKFIGYGVQIFDSGGKLLTEAYEPASLKQEVAGK